MGGPINDQGWNASAYNGLVKIEEVLGATIAYAENLALSDNEDQFRAYAEAGFDIVFGHGYTFIDAAFKVAGDYPDTKFLLTSSAVTQDPNIGSVSDDGLQKGFIGGVVAGILTESNKIGYIGGMEIPPIVAGMNGFSAGATHVNPDVEIMTVLTGDFTDAAKTKEFAYSFIDAGVDIILVQSDMGSLGAIEAGQERGVKIIGMNTDQNVLGPDTVVTSAVADFPLAMMLVAKEVEDGTWVPSVRTMGLKENVVYLAPYHSFEDKLTQENKDSIDAVLEEIIAGMVDATALTNAMFGE